MRYDTPVYFVKTKRGALQPNGNYSKVAPEETLRLADVTDAQEQAMVMFYGSIKQGALVVRLNTHYNEPFDYIRIGGTRYKADKTRRLRHKHVFLISEV